MAIVTAAIQTISLIGSLLIVLVAGGVFRHWRTARPFALLPGVWAALGATYYALVLAGRLTPDALLLWGAVHRLMAVVMVFGMVVTLALVMAAPPLEDEERDDTD